MLLKLFKLILTTKLVLNITTNIKKIIMLVLKTHHILILYNLSSLSNF